MLRNKWGKSIGWIKPWSNLGRTQQMLSFYLIEWYTATERTLIRSWWHAAASMPLWFPVLNTCTESIQKVLQTSSLQETSSSSSFVITIQSSLNLSSPTKPPSALYRQVLGTSGESRCLNTSFLLAAQLLTGNPHATRETSTRTSSMPFRENLFTGSSPTAMEIYIYQVGLALSWFYCQIQLVRP